MKPDTPLVTMREDERVCFDRAMDQWLASIKRLDLSEKDRVKGALLAYQRQAFVFHEKALLQAHQRGRREGMEEAAKVADEREAICDDACKKVDAGELYADVPTAFASENSARMEAGHIGRLIRAKIGVQTRDRDAEKPINAGKSGK